jgi:hypothetical protein
MFKKAMNREYESLRKMNAWEECLLPKGRKAIDVRWVYAYKLDDMGVPREGEEKARLVAKGFSQCPEDYGETYAPVARMASIRIVLSLAAVNDMELYGWDCKTAFLHARLRQDIYIRQIPGFSLPNPSLVLKLNVALYGLRQAAYEFYQLVLSVMNGIGMQRSEVDHAFFYGVWTTPPDPSIPMPRSGKLQLFVPLHIDDGLTASLNKELYVWFLSQLQRCLTIIDLGPAQLYLGCRITRDHPKRLIYLSQEAFISELLDEYNMTEAPPLGIPIKSQLSEMKDPPPGALPAIADEDLKVKYQSLVGSLLYLALCTRPDIAYICMALGQHNSSPSRKHMVAVKSVLWYLVGTRRMGMCFGRKDSEFPKAIQGYIHHAGFSDSDWASDISNRRSIAGFCYFFLGCCISWSAVKQKSVALSSAEAEYYALTHAVKEALWLRMFLLLIDIPIPTQY